MIDKVDASVTNLEAAAYKLDTYSKELGMVMLEHLHSKQAKFFLN